jgi:hypothetical protein
MTPEFITGLIALITPFIVYGATEVAKKLLPFLTGGWVLFAVPLVSAVVTYVSQLAVAGSPHWYFQLLIGVLAVFVNELKKVLFPPTV